VGAYSVPSYVSTHYPDGRLARRRRLTGTWVLAWGSFFLPLLALLAVPLAIRAGVKGNWRGWLILVVALGCAVGGYLALWTPATSR
jgi:hypothetical protein